MKIALCQFHIEWENKDLNIRRAEKFVREAADASCELILFPEMSYTGFSSNVDKTKENDGQTQMKMQSLAQEYKIAIGYGWVKENEDKHEKAENHYSIIEKSGEMLSDYTKIHSFEYGGEGKQFVSGNKLSLFKLNEINFAQFICYDLRFPEIFQVASNSADVLLVPANWPRKRKEHWNCLLRARAIENQAYVLGINCVGEIGGLDYSGNSCVVNPDGKVEVALSELEGVIFADICKEKLSIRESFPVKKDRKNDLYKSLL